MHNPGRGRSRLLVFAVLVVAGVLAPAGAAQADNAFVDNFPNTTFIENRVDVLGTPGQVIEVDAPAFHVDWSGDRHLSPNGSFGVSMNAPGSPYVAYDPETFTVPGTWALGSRYTFRPKLRVTMPTTLGVSDQFVSFTAAPTGACTAGFGECIAGNPLTVRVHLEVKPNPVSDFKATGDNSAIDLSWATHPEQAQLSGYHIDRTDMTTRTNKIFHGVDPNTTTFRDTQTVPDHEYCYSIYAYWEEQGGAGRFTSSDRRITCGYINRAPGAPGAPAPAPSLTNGQTTVSWSPAVDPDGNAVTYTLEHQDADDGGWSTERENVTDTSLTVAEDEGTWRYRVRATDSHGVAGPWSDAGPEHKADATGPGAPQVSLDKAPVDGWFADSVTVSFDGAEDPVLADGSAGSGVASHSGPEVVTGDVERTVTGTATDNAGNTGAPAHQTVKVDATAPELTLECPTAPVLRGSDATATWRATDAGSGPATATGTIELETGDRGPQTATAPAGTAHDAVGHPSAEATCQYEVNAPPAAPGAPEAPARDRDGSFEVTWDEASDEDGDPVGYLVERIDNDDAGWSDAGAGDDSLAQEVSVADGTWRFRVKALDGRGGESEWVESEAPTTVDGIAPSAPSAVTDPADAAGENWFKDSVTVSFGGSEDPNLPDGSAGVGELTYSDAKTFDEEGSFTHSGTATDALGNESEPSERAVRVDSTPPRASITCPSDRVVAGTDAVATWAASDDESGLATPAGGTVELDTDTPGTWPANAPVARDVVGHETAAEPCRYVVVPPNRAPGAPGAPGGPATDRDGSFELSWRAAADPDENDPTTYVVEGRDADDGDSWTEMATGSTAPRTDVELADGTWDFRVKAVDSHGAATDWVPSPAPVKVDGGRPTAPQAGTTADEPSTEGWFKDSVKVSFAGSQDPALLDGSTGSGVDSYEGGGTFDETGTHSATGVAIDGAGNESEGTEVTVNVDASRPSTQIACPSEPLIVGQPGGTATWTASDTGSGLASGASGSVALNTATAGAKTASAPAATDKVGHTGEVVRCEYEVRYRFAGTVAPVEGSNVVNVGRRGKTYPVRWRLSRWNGSLISDAEGAALARQMAVTDTKVACSSFLTAGEDNLEEDIVAPSTAVRYDTYRNLFVYAYRAPAAGCFTLDVRRADGVNSKRWRFLFL